jgi:hypothetical protein
MRSGGAGSRGQLCGLLAAAHRARSLDGQDDALAGRLATAGDGGVGPPGAGGVPGGRADAYAGRACRACRRVLGSPRPGRRLHAGQRLGGRPHARRAGRRAAGALARPDAGVDRAPHAARRPGGRGGLPGAPGDGLAGMAGRGGGRGRRQPAPGARRAGRGHRRDRRGAGGAGRRPGLPARAPGRQPGQHRDHRQRPGADRLRLRRAGGAVVGMRPPCLRPGQPGAGRAAAPGRTGPGGTGRPRPGRRCHRPGPAGRLRRADPRGARRSRLPRLAGRRSPAGIRPPPRRGRGERTTAGGPAAGDHEVARRLVPPDPLTGAELRRRARPPARAAGRRCCRTGDPTPRAPAAACWSRSCQGRRSPRGTRACPPRPR